MTFSDHDPGHEQDDNVDSRLEAALNDETLQRYLEGSGPLTIAELPEELRLSEAFESFVGQYDWPSHQNADAISPVREYEDPATFWRCMYDDALPASLRLTNFRNWLAVRPIESITEARRGIDLWGFKPPLHRAYAVAEPFMDSLREIVNMVEPGTQNCYAVAEQHPRVPEAAYAAYRLLGRLVVEDDIATASRHLRGGQADPDSPIVTDAHEYLVT